MSNFSFLDVVADQWGELQELAQQAESQIRLNPRGACFFARYALERTVREMYRIDKWLKKPYESTLRITTPDRSTLRAFIHRKRSGQQRDCRALLPGSGTKEHCHHLRDS
ncbi:hypothetical protein NX722_25650 [Endozoicomonas gorgoniicola]|uniref:Uncharacterized protein n=1 Tax=Endozoicomonas gorgoniicola TaxID=1234144 RepID=A0ABT3N2U0_9GAMM|nr:hypothetical protein [Endozoicomonas gorgoniicola]MCW7555952.1 hypothetical protein [Endozoicomonas gorgoniicola]